MKNMNKIDYLILVDKFNPLPDDYTKQILFEEVSGKLFEREAAEHLKKLLGSARNDEVYLKIISGYRTAEYQQMLWENEIRMLMAQGLDYEQAKKETAKTLAPPGGSEHFTGLAVDFGYGDDDDVSYEFDKTAGSKWLLKNAFKFGFILRYPRMKEHLTGISYEPWHYRYVGEKYAGLITDSGICLEEFLHYYSGFFA